MTSERVSISVKSVYADSPIHFDIKPFDKVGLRLGDEYINIPALQVCLPPLAPIPPIVYNYNQAQGILGQFALHAIFPEGKPMCVDKFLEPWAVNLPIGWALCGPRPPYSSSNTFNCLIV